jgi:hypothetical protein
MQVALSTTKAEYIAMSQALRDVFPIMFLIQEIMGEGVSSYLYETIHLLQGF